jgi:hypothetical protein
MGRNNARSVAADVAGKLLRVARCVIFAGARACCCQQHNDHQGTDVNYLFHPIKNIRFALFVSITALPVFQNLQAK